MKTSLVGGGREWLSTFICHGALKAAASKKRLKKSDKEKIWANE